MKKQIISYASIFIFLSGCAAIEKQMEAARQQEAAYYAQREAALVTGTSTNVFQAAWGQPKDITTAVVSSTTVETWQYGSCGRGAVRSGVMFATFINDQLITWSSGQC